MRPRSDTGNIEVLFKTVATTSESLIYIERSLLNMFLERPNFKILFLNQSVWNSCGP